MYKKILLTVDLGNIKGQDKAVKTAVQLAETFSATLHIITVVPDYGMSIVGTYFPENYEETMIADTKAKLDAFVAENVPEGVKSRKIVAHGTIYTEILDYANNTETDLIVMASHRPDLQDYLVGPNAARVVRHSKCSAMVVRP